MFKERDEAVPPIWLPSVPDDEMDAPTAREEVATESSLAGYPVEFQYASPPTVPALDVETVPTAVKVRFDPPSRAPGVPE